MRCVIIRIPIFLLFLLLLGSLGAVMNQSAIPAEIRERIIAAAVELYENAGRESLPTVDQVRRAARADMNATSTVMKEWRRQQTAQAAPVAVTVPESVAQANTVALAELWRQAQELANESLQAAQAAWEAERLELDTLRAELADAYEAQLTELDQTQAAAVAADQAHQLQRQQAAGELASVRAELAQAVTRAERAEAKVDEIERRAGELRAELDRAHSEADQMQGALIEAHQATQVVTAQLEEVRVELEIVKAKAETDAEKHQEQLDAAGIEARNLAERLTRAQAECDQAKQDAGSARERAAELTGQLSVHQEQTAALLARLVPTEAEAPAKDTSVRRTPKTED